MIRNCGGKKSYDLPKSQARPSTEAIVTSRILGSLLYMKHGHFYVTKAFLACFSSGFRWRAMTALKGAHDPHNHIMQPSRNPGRDSGSVT